MILKLWVFKSIFFFLFFFKIESTPPEVFFQKVFRKYEASLRESTHAEEQFEVSYPCLNNTIFETKLRGNASGKCNFINFLNKVQLTLTI